MGSVGAGIRSISDRGGEGMRSISLDEVSSEGFVDDIVVSYLR